MNKNSHLLGRILLAIIFILAGIGEIKDPAGTMGYMASVGLPGILLWPTIALGLLGGIAIVIGFKTSIVAVALAIFTVVAGVLFRNNMADQMQSMIFLKGDFYRRRLAITSV
ncbi:MAG: DoxX family protein [Methylophilaceae bacterium]|nr:DoxX family protein [Methylophilaceae bacterium]